MLKYAIKEDKIKIVSIALKKKTLPLNWQGKKLAEKNPAIGGPRNSHLYVSRVMGKREIDVQIN